VERRIALALAAAGASTLAAGVITASAVGVVPLLGFDGVRPHSQAAAPVASAHATPGAEPRIVTQLRDVYDDVVVGALDADSAGKRVNAVPAVNSGPAGGATPVANRPESAPVTASPVTTPAAPPAPTPTTAGPTPTTAGPPALAPGATTTTTRAPTTTTTRPPGVPSDWPANKPIPPMPAGCQQPQLEDNGVWNCDH
jgi:hypothetical protein